MTDCLALYSHNNQRQHYSWSTGACCFNDGVGGNFCGCGDELAVDYWGSCDEFAVDNWGSCDEFAGECCSDIACYDNIYTVTDYNDCSCCLQ
nr:hypothetical protein BaRGS_013106 [Batillaria attramentaria]